MTRRRKTTKPLAVPNLSWPDPPRTGFSLWSRTQKNTPRPAAGDSLNLTMANLSTRPCSTPAFPATRRSKLVIWSSPVTHLNTESHTSSEAGQGNAPKPGRVQEVSKLMDAWNQNRLTARLGTDYPIIQGPFGGLS